MVMVGLLGSYCSKTRIINTVIGASASIKAVKQVFNTITRFYNIYKYMTTLDIFRLHVDNGEVLHETV